MASGIGRWAPGGKYRRGPKGEMIATHPEEVRTMRYFLDTEFHEDGKTIDLISLGLVAEVEGKVDKNAMGIGMMGPHLTVQKITASS